MVISPIRTSPIVCSCFIDNDDIPELYLSGASEADGGNFPFYFSYFIIMFLVYSRGGYAIFFLKA
jgi:hypothetical protein